MQRLTRKSYFIFSLGKGTDAAANTRRLLCFQLGHTIKKKQKKKKIKNFKKKKEKEIKKIESPKKNKKIIYEFLVLADKMCVFSLYPIPDSQQCLKRGSCRPPILSRLLCLFYWSSNLFLLWFIYFVKSSSHFVLVIYFVLFFILYLIVSCV